jgi:hypothetical protein
MGIHPLTVSTWRVLIFEMCRLKFPYLTRALLKTGYSLADIRKIYGGRDRPTRRVSNPPQVANLPRRAA